VKRRPRRFGFAWVTIPAVVLSSSTDPDDIRISYLLGASAYHSKPASFDELRRQLKTLYEYWMTCHLPDVETCGKHSFTSSKGKLGERFAQPLHKKQTRV
jgi:DNA-binding NarL/FixJ family response regulator